MGLKRGAIDTAHRLGMFGAVGRMYGARRLTVLAYHRVTDHTAPGFTGFVGNVSATPAEFEAQLRWLAPRFTVVTLDAVADAARGARLPRRPLVITFDDGYRDNLQQATPILERVGLPAAGFLATGLIGGGAAPWWDLAAVWFQTTALGEADLPVAGPRAWTDGRREALSWIRAAKRLPDAELRAAVERLPGALEVTVDDSRFVGLMLGWDEVAAMAGRGWQFGGHTCSHPILTRVPIEHAMREVQGSHDRVAEAVGARPRGFAYPNGQPADFDTAVRAVVADAGFDVGFTLVPGPARWSEFSSDPLAIRRVYVHHGDGVSRLAAKVGGVARFIEAVR
ncbi:MAG: polysaccharide deacetylase family protein [Actinomycetota bacterium]